MISLGKEESQVRQDTASRLDTSPAQNRVIVGALTDKHLIPKVTIQTAMWQRMNFQYLRGAEAKNWVPWRSKVIFHHQDLKMNQIYLGKMSESGAIRWMEILHGK